MAKLIVFFALIAMSQAGVFEYGQPTIIKQVQPTIIKKIVEAEAPANYQFQYEVNEPSTGDVKSQQEKAENGVIKGSYQLNEADGYVRIVEYTADDANGFLATVRREPQTQVVKKIITQPATLTKIIQPAVTKVIAPSHGWA